MTRPPWEVADVIRRTGNKFLKRYRQSLTWAQVKVLAAIVRCRTAALGGHRDQCRAADIKPSRIIRAGTGIVRSVRPMPGRSGCTSGNRNFCRWATII